MLRVHNMKAEQLNRDGYELLPGSVEVIGNHKESSERRSM